MHYAGELTPDQFWAVVDDGDDRIRRTFAERPVWAVRGWRGRTILSEWTYGSGGGIRALVFLPAEWDGANFDDPDVSPRVVVLTDVEEPRRIVAGRFAMEEFARTHEPPVMFDEAPTPDAVIELIVDGTAEPFELWAGGDAVRVAGSVGGVGVVIEASGHPIEEVELARLHEIEDVLAERRRWIRSQRGGI